MPACERAIARFELRDCLRWSGGRANTRAVEVYARRPNNVARAVVVYRSARHVNPSENLWGRPTLIA